MTFNGHQDKVTSIAFSFQTPLLASSSRDHTVWGRLGGDTAYWCKLSLKV